MFLHKCNSYRSHNPTYLMTTIRTKLHTSRLQAADSNSHNLIKNLSHPSQSSSSRRKTSTSRLTSRRSYFWNSVHNGLFLQPGTGRKDIQVQQQHATEEQRWKNGSDPQGKNGRLPQKNLVYQGSYYKYYCFDKYHTAIPNQLL